MSHPLIGISIQHETYNSRQVNGISYSYIQAVKRAGGTPLLLPKILPLDDLPSLLARLQGLLLTGGPDISPIRYGALMHPSVGGVDPQRDEFDIRLATTAIETGLPLLGICRGFQILNVATGGTLYTEIYEQHPNALYHSCYKPGLPEDLLVHHVNLAQGSRLAEIVEQKVIQVNSLHHQGIRRLGSGLQAAAFAPDGLVESVEIDGHPFGIGVQWHPELLPEIFHSQALFRAFIAAARLVG